MKEDKDSDFNPSLTDSVPEPVPAKHIDKSAPVLTAKYPRRPLVMAVAVFLILIVITVIVLVVRSNSTTTPAQQTLPKKVIGLSLTSLRIQRWQTDRDYMQAEAERLGMLLNVMDANDDPVLQISQSENLILQGVNVLIVVANDSTTSAKIVEFAHQHGVKVIAYDRLILNSDLDYYVSFDSVDVGKKEAEGVVAAAGDKVNYAYIGGSPTDNNAILLKQGTMQVLQPKINAGKIKLVLDKFTPDWNQAIAYQTMKDFLHNGGKVDAVVAANDGNATGVIQALSEYGLAGKVPVSGQDAELTACKRIVQGTQTITVYKPFKLLATATIDLADQIINNETVTTTAKMNNGKIDVPAIYIDSVKVTKDNMMDTIIKDGFHTYAEVYQ